MTADASLLYPATPREARRPGTYGVKSQSWSWAAGNGSQGLQPRRPALPTQFQGAARRGWERGAAETLSPALPL